ncbi:hypothetical protein FZEAL_2507 [Fusarium zealandicum]|uniref:Uncharacterized protein n=1 Tax=Fusarium zealandicum TaxID=1053134 RepID=A0A8H4URA9_9HYPO|nr:hypothetical protein FZEAL_2507 [Fusarium zealandicum]
MRTRSPEAHVEAESSSSAAAQGQKRRPRLTTPDLEYDYDRTKLRDPRATPGRVNRQRLESHNIDDDFKNRFSIPKPERPKGISKNGDAWYAMQALADLTDMFHHLHVCHKKGRNGSPTYDSAGFQLDWEKVNDWMKPQAFNKKRMVNGMARHLDRAAKEEKAMFDVFFKDGKAPEGGRGTRTKDYLRDHVSKDLGIPWHQIDSKRVAKWGEKGFPKVKASEWWHEPNDEENKRMMNMMGGASLRRDL